MKVAIVGASGAVGQEFLRVLEQREFPIRELLLFGSERSAGRTYKFRGKEIVVKQLAHNDDFKGVSIAFVSAGAGTSKEFAGTITKHGTLMIDNSSAFRMDDEVPLVVPEVNPRDGVNPPRRIIANPNCTTIQMVVALQKNYPMPLLLAGCDPVYVGRIRKDITDPNGLAFWCVSDQIRKGAALNAVQIAEYLVANGHVK